MQRFSSRDRWAGSWAQLWPKTGQKPRTTKLFYLPYWPLLAPIGPYWPLLAQPSGAESGRQLRHVFPARPPSPRLCALGPAKAPPRHALAGLGFFHWGLVAVASIDGRAGGAAVDPPRQKAAARRPDKQ